MPRMLPIFKRKRATQNFSQQWVQVPFPNLAERLYWRTYKDGRITTDLLTNVSED